MPKPVSVTLTGVSTSPWKNLDFYRSGFTLQIDSFVTGTVTYNIETTATDYLAGLTANVSVWTSAATTTGRTTVTAPCRAWRLNITAGTGSVTAEAVQTGLA